MIVTPAIIPEDIEDLEGKLLLVKGIVRAVQIDVCDGRLTPKASWPYTNDYDREFDKMIAQERGMPLWEHFDFEIDMMVLNPGREYERWIDAGASRIIFHYKESEAAALKEMIRNTKERGVEAGLALHVNDPISVVDDFAADIDCLQFMGINRIGFQGESFEESVLSKIRDVKAKYSDLPLSVDGGVNADTAELLTDAGIDRLVIGSALFQSGDIREAYTYFATF